MIWTVLMASGLALADDAWAARDVALLRWPPAVMEGAPQTAEVSAGARLEIVLDDGDQVRVRVGEDFGWIPADALSREAPEQPPEQSPEQPADSAG